MKILILWNEILKKQDTETKKKFFKTLENLKEIKKIGYESKRLIENNDLNEFGKLLDYHAVMECIEKTGHLGASPVKEALIKLADEWLDGTQNPDDITFVVLEKNDSVDTPKKLTGEKSESVPKVAQA